MSQPPEPPLQPENQPPSDYPDVGQPASASAAGTPDRTDGGGSDSRVGMVLLGAVIGALIASLLWAGGVFLLGGGGTPDVGDYKVKNNLCKELDLDAFEGYALDSDAKNSTSKLDSFDQMSCGGQLEGGISTSPSNYSPTIQVTVNLAKKQDPAVTFADSARAYPEFDNDNDLRKISGLGDEAYLVRGNNRTGPGSTQFYYLTVLDGAMTYTMQYSQYSPPSAEGIYENHTEEWIEDSAKGTLANLRD